MPETFTAAVYLKIVLCDVPVVYDKRAGGGGHVLGPGPRERHSTREVRAPLQILNLVGKQIP